MSWQNEIEGLFRKLKPVVPHIDSLWIAYNTETDPRSRAEIAGILYSLASKYLDETYDKKLLLSLPDEKLIDGEYRLGKVTYGDSEYHPFGLKEEEWLRHVGVFGTSGSGKTNCAFLILWSLRKKQKPFLIFDWKRNYRDLLSFEEFRDTKIFTIGRDISPLSFNPLVPPKNTNPKSWLKKLIEVMCHAYFLGEGVAYLLQKAIDQAYSESGVYSGGQEYPTFHDVLDILEKMQVKGRKALWMDSTLRTLGVLCFGEFGNILNVRNPSPIGKLLKKNVILELDALPNSDKTFFIESLLLWIHHSRLSEGARETFKHAILIEEAHHILLRKKQETTGTEAITDIILREIRELGESIILIDQHPSLISMPALGNTYTTICFGLKHRADMRTISESLLLENDQVDFLGQLETGTAIVKLQGRYFKPFLVRFPLFPIKKGVVRDKEIRAEFREESHESEDIRPVRSSVKEEGMEVVLTEKEREFLVDIAQYPVSGVVSRYNRLGLNRYQGNKLQGTLIEKSLIDWKSVSTKTGRLKVLVLTEQGKKSISDVKIDKIFSKRGSFEHEYAKFKVGDYYRKKGYWVTFEYKLSGGKSVDLVAEKDGKKIAVEIETGKSDAIYNISKNLNVGFTDIITLAINEKVKHEITLNIKKTGIYKNKGIRLLDIGEFFDTVKK